MDRTLLALAPAAAISPALACMRATPRPAAGASDGRPEPSHAGLVESRPGVFRPEADPRARPAAVLACPGPAEAARPVHSRACEIRPAVR